MRVRPVVCAPTRPDGNMSPHRRPAGIQLEWVQGKVPLALTSLVCLLVIASLHYGSAVSMVPLPRLHPDEAELLDQIRAKSEARAGIREIEAYLRAQIQP